MASQKQFENASSLSSSSCNSVSRTKEKRKVFLVGSISIMQQFKIGATVIHLKNQ